jgi:hypothetical protein
MKLSRKFAEPNVFTQIKALFIVHRVSTEVEQNAKTEWCNALLSLRNEQDEKLGQNYFAIESVSSSGSSLSTVQELKAAAFLRCYSVYLFNFMEYQQKKLMKQTLPSLSDSWSSLSELLEGTKKVRSAAPDISLFRQITELLIKDENDILKDLTAFYEKNYQQLKKYNKNGKSEGDLIRLIQQFNPNYQGIVSDTVADKKKFIAVRSKKTEMLKKNATVMEMKKKIISSKQTKTPLRVVPAQKQTKIPTSLVDSVRKSVGQPLTKEILVVRPVVKFVKSDTQKKFEKGKGLSSLLSSVSSSFSLPSSSSFTFRKKKNPAGNKKSIINVTKKSVKTEKKCSK